jgi:hypothetical protein
MDVYWVEKMALRLVRQMEKMLVERMAVQKGYSMV